MAQCDARGWKFWLVVGLFFAAVGASSVPPVSAVDLEAENERLKQAVRELTAQLAVARSETDLFQKRAAEAQLRAQTLGVNFEDSEATQAQRQLIESVRALHAAETARAQLAEELNRLVRAIEQNVAVTVEVARAQQVLATSSNAAAMAVAPDRDGVLERATVLDVNPGLQMAVLNVGKLQGVRVGMPFVVLHGDRVVAELKVIEVRQKICGALIEKVEKGVTVKPGDPAQVTKS